jgi:hypothetical protein
MPCQSGKSEEQIKLAYVEAFRYGNVPFYFTRNSGGTEDATAMAEGFKVFNRKVEMLLSRYLLCTGDVVYHPETFDLKSFTLEICAARHGTQAFDNRTKAIYSQRPCVIIMLGNKTGANNLRLHMQLFNNQRAFKEKDVVRAKAVAFFDEADAQCGTDDLTGAMKKVMQRRLPAPTVAAETDETVESQVASAIDSDESSLFLLDVTAHAAFIRRYHTSGTVFAMVAQASATALNTASTPQTNLVVLRPDISASYNGFAMTVPETHAPERIIKRISVPVAANVKRRRTKKAKLAKPDEDCVADDEYKTVFEREQSGLHYMLDDVVANDTQTRSALILTDTTATCDKQHEMATGVQSYLKSKNKTAVILVWNYTGLFVYSSARDDWSAAFQEAAYNLRIADSRCSDYSESVIAAFKGSIRDGLSLVHRVYTTQPCKETVCNQYATYGEPQCLPTHCDEHGQCYEKLIRTGIKVISVSGAICGRAVPVKTRDHLLPLTDMYANRRITNTAGPSLEAINQVSLSKLTYECASASDGLNRTN